MFKSNPHTATLRRDSNSIMNPTPAPLRAGPPRIVDVSWTVDVTLGTSETGGGTADMRPSVTMRLKMDDGRTVAFECSLERFHELREATATMVNEMDWVTKDVDAVREIGARARAGWDRVKMDASAA